MEQLAGYLPNFTLNRLSGSGWNRRHPLRDEGTGAVMLVDISGFTSLTKQWIAGGAAGLEQLTVILNTYFDRMAALIAEHGGQVVNFAGDALLAVWHTEDREGGDASAVPYAVQCAVRLRDVLHHRELVPNLRLALRLVIGAGSYGIHFTGGVQGRWELILAGEAIAQMSGCSPFAGTGEVLLSPEAAAFVNGRCTLEPVPGLNGGGFVSQWNSLPSPSGFPVPAKQLPGSTDLLLPYLPKTVWAAVTAGRGEWSAELRHATVLFIHLPGFHLNAGLDLMHQAVEIIQNTMLLLEGTINKISLDDKGIAVIAAMGLPSMAHEDDPARALQASMTIRTHLENRGVFPSIGISTGVVYCGTIGSAVRREYTMIGDVMNRAARLMQAAEGGILCDGTTARSAAGQVQTESRGELVLKGFPEPVAVYCPVGLIKAAPDLPPLSLVGRKTETDAIRRQIEKLLQGTGGALLISGEAGMGKSHLVRFARDAALRHGVRVLLGAGDAIEKLTPYYPWKAIFGDCFGFVPGEDPREQADRVSRLEETVRRLLPASLHLLPLLNAVLPLELKENEWTRQMEGRLRAENTQAILAELLRQGIGPEPALIMLDDAHWMDSASWSLLLEAVKGLPGVCFLLAHRPDSGSLPAEYRLLAGQPSTAAIQLGGMPEDDTVQLICDRLGVDRLSEEVRKLIVSKTEGHPLFSEELAYSLRDRGFLEIADGECRLAERSGSLRDALFQPTIQGIIMSRIDRLPPREQLVLKVASVIGRLFTYAYLRGILPYQSLGQEVKAQLSALEQVNLTLLQSMQPDLTYLFRHIITQEVTYNMLLQSQRVSLHRAAAEWLEQHEPEQPAHYSILAHHWSQAGVAEKAVAYLEKVGLEALKTGAYPEAVQAFRNVLHTAPDDTSDHQSAQWHMLMGVAYMGVGDMAQADTYLKKALTLFGKQPAATPRQFRRDLAKQSLIQLLHRLFPSRYRGRMKHRSKDLIGPARCHFCLSEIAFFTNKPADNIYHSLHGLNLEEESGDSVQLAQIMGNMCVTAGIMKLYPLARAYQKQARGVAERVGEHLATAWVKMDFSLYHIGIGQWREAREYAAEGMKIYEKIGDRRYWEACSYLYVKVLNYHHADYEAGSRLAAAIYDSGKRSGNAQGQSWGLLAQAENKLAVDDLPEALRLLQEAEALVPANIGQTEEIRAFGLLALTLQRMGKSADAQAYADRALSLVEQSAPTAYYAFDGYAALTEVYLALWEEAGLEKRRELLPYVRRSMKALKAFASVFPIAKPRLLLHAGTWAWLEGKSKQAAAVWNRSLGWSARLSMPYEETRAYRELSRRSKPGSREREEYERLARRRMENPDDRV